MTTNPTPVSTKPAADMAVEREKFESIFPMPANCIWTGNGYAATDYNAWGAHGHKDKWDGWKARAALARPQEVAGVTEASKLFEAANLDCHALVNKEMQFSPDADDTYVAVWVGFREGIKVTSAVAPVRTLKQEVSYEAAMALAADWAVITPYTLGNGDPGISVKFEVSQRLLGFAKALLAASRAPVAVGVEPELRRILREVTAVAITQLFEAYPEDTSAEFNIDELQLVSDASSALRPAQVEHIYRRGFDLTLAATPSAGAGGSVGAEPARVRVDAIDEGGIRHTLKIEGTTALEDEGIGVVVAFPKQIGEMKCWIHDCKTVEQCAESGCAVRSSEDSARFKNFHRSLCARFDYTHDEKDWRRDLVSLEEHIAAKVCARQDKYCSECSKTKGADPAWHEAYVTLPQRLDELIAQHGTLRAAARVIDIDASYLSRLHSGEKVKPGKDFLRRMGLRAATTYERTK